MLVPTKSLALPVGASQSSEAPSRAVECVNENRVGELVASEYAAVWRFLRRLGVPARDVDDTAQRVFARVLAKANRIQPGSERAYLMRAAFRAALEQQRAHKRQAARAIDLEVDETLSAYPLPEQILLEREDLALLDRALATLPDDLRAALTLFEIEGLTFSEIAVALDIPRGTVASRVRRARERFTEALRRLEARPRR
jgi:RNA polymerase sigma-70 factor (ECF subfamily)